MAKKKKFSISPRNQKAARKSLEELMKEEGNQIIGDNIQGGWVEYEGSEDDPGNNKKQ